MNEKSGKLKSTYQFHKNKIEQKYKLMVGQPTQKTKMGQESFQEFQKYKNELKREVEKIEQNRIFTQIYSKLKSKVREQEE